MLNAPDAEGLLPIQPTVSIAARLYMPVQPVVPGYPDRPYSARSVERRSLMSKERQYL